MSPARVAYGPVDEADGRVTRINGMNGGVVDNAIYVDGIRTANPATLDETYDSCANDTAWRGSGCTAPPRRRSNQWRPNSGCTIWSSMTPSPPTNGPSWSGTAPSCSPCYVPPAISTGVSRSSSVSCTWSPATGSSSPSGTPRAPISPASGAVWNLSRISCGSDQKPSFTASWTRSSTSTPPSLQDWRTTSTKSRTSSSTTTRPPHAASTPSLAR